MAQTVMYDIMRRSAGLAAQLRIKSVRRWQSQVQEVGSPSPETSQPTPSTVSEAHTSLDSARSLVQEAVRQNRRSTAQLQDIGSLDAHVPTKQQAAAPPSTFDEDWVLVDTAGIQSDIEKLNASYSRWRFLRGALLVGLGTTVAFASYRGSRYATIVWCQRSIRALQKRLDHEKVDERNRHDLEGLGFNYLWWINMMLSKD
jgi:hypothetical protein